MNLLLTDPTIILGYTIMDQNFIPLNTILLVAKSYILRCLNRSIPLNILQLQHRIQTTYYDQRTISVINGREQKFIRYWQHWVRLFEN